MLTRTSPFAASMTIHIGAAILLFTMISVPISQHTPIRSRTPTFINLDAYRRSLKLPGGGGGGARAILPVSQGALPKPAPRPYIPPMVRDSTREPVLLLPPALTASADIPNVNLPQWGDPLSGSHALSSGSGLNGGLGTGEGGGFGPHKGPGIGPGPGGPGGVRDLHAGVRGRVTAPQVLYQVDPEFSEEARRAKHYGTVILVVDVDTSGRAVNVRIAKSLGLGLDEKAVEAVSRWKFRPAQKDGKPVTVPATIEVNFHLL